ncbi:hypothetical protein ZIOFF_021934 [Zingiber officinale]|uniref:N-acetyltransferase ESCO zinc-finger domain-containing protein n=1 Tax=Zingiber officinale TaxID=94328 RepID=A0A8J5H7P8_ZINOF|nr:hypothetical protein ZIOFF_021934 [Zingiber officinale]
MLNTKRSYTQYHLELGQSDFLLRSCSVCGMMYAPGDESDEKLHGDFHKKYYEGIRFKGWRDERVVSTPNGGNCRILLVLDGDSPSHKRRVYSGSELLESSTDGSDSLLKMIWHHSNAILYGGGMSSAKAALESDTKVLAFELHLLATKHQAAYNIGGKVITACQLH